MNNYHNDMFEGIEIVESATLDGVFQGAQGRLVGVMQDGKLLVGAVRRRLAKQLSQHINGGELRFHILGRWKRVNGKWILLNFVITDYEVLNQTDFLETVKQLRAIKGSEWETMDDPWSVLADLRGGDE